MSQLSRNERLAVLAKAHEVYARNQYVRVDGKIERFEDPAYHNGMVDLYRSRINTDEDA
jgi:hypothetical protein